jgi:hypothetical protein
LGGIRDGRVDEQTVSALGIEPFERPLRVFAFDPSRGRTPANVVTLRLPYERLEPGPVGRYVAVIDYNRTLDRTYDPVDLGALDVVLRGGRDPSELDFQFHQQMVYAVASRTIQAFERALGRPIRWPWATSADPPRPEDKLRIYPHAERIANAWASPQTGELFFGYDLSQEDGTGRGEQLVFSCLAYDIVAHEMVHPLLHAVVPKAADTVSDDSRAFHEGFADLIALLQHFDFEHALLDAIFRTNGRIWELTTAPDISSEAQALIQAERAGTNPLLEIGRQFGRAIGAGGPIRTALGSPPDAAAFPSTEPHQRGAIFVAAVFDALFTVYARRIRDLLRVGGVRGRDDPLHPDLARRLAGEARSTAHRFLDLCIRALDYCPPVDIQFDDYLRALVTLDAEVAADDDWGYREALLEGFRARGIGAKGVLSYSEEGLRWPRHDGTLPACAGLRLDEAEADANRELLRSYAGEHRQALGLDPKLRLEVSTPVVRTSQRIGPQGQLQREFILQVTQGRDRHGGTALILDQQGAPKYVIAKPRRGRRGGQAGTAQASARPAPDPLRHVPHAPHGRPPDRRPLKIFAFDPTRGRGFGNRLEVSVPYEPLEPGPVGRQLAVVDYDASNDRYYEAVDLDDPGILLGGGLDPTDLTPQFHQQMVYAVAAATVERFELGLARPVVWRWVRRGQPPLSNRLLIHPHAMHEANAYYDRGLHALLFGYFAAAEESPGGNLPGQIVHTCLSHDIVVHETTHAIVDSIRPYFLDQTGPDAAAFHEAFADIVALLEHFGFPEALQETIQRTGGQIHNLQFDPETRADPAGARIGAERPTSNPLVELARQFGEALGTRAALRSALGTPPDSRALEAATEAHDRGAILVAALFDAFFSVYVRRTADLLRLGRAGGAVTRWGDLNPDLATRLAREATSTAERFALMCVRALDYCPPVDVEFGDFLRSLITADFEVEPNDPLGYRAALVDAFSARGIYPATVRSLSEEALLWHRAEVPAGLRCEGLDVDPGRPDSAQRNAVSLRDFARRNARVLGLSNSAPINVRRVQSTTSSRVDPHGNLRPEFHVQLEQRRVEPVDPDDPGSATFVFRGGATAVLDHQGGVRYLIGKGIDDQARLRRQREYLREVAGRGPAAAYRGALVRPLQLSALHRGFDA